MVFFGDKEKEKLMQKKIGIVFSGGGAKGAYQIGVWQALIDLDIAPLITGIAGTSVGAINGVLFAQKDINIGYEIWEKAKLKPLDFESFNKRRKFFVKLVGENNINALYNITKSECMQSKRLQALIKIHLKPDKINQFNGDCFIATHDTHEKKPIYFNLKKYAKDEQVKIILASASIPYIFSTVSIEGRKLNDGGLSDNTPIKPLYDAGYQVIIVVYLSRINIYPSNYFPNATIINLIPSKSLGDFRTGTLNFSDQKIDWLIEQGYEDTLRATHKIMAFQKIIPYTN